MKNEWRLLDIFAFGPAMIWVGSRKEFNLTGFARMLFVFGGMSVLSYNGVNYLKNAGIIKGVK